MNDDDSRGTDDDLFGVKYAGEPGKLIEAGPTSKIFTNPDDERTEAYITGRFG